MEHDDSLLHLLKPENLLLLAFLVVLAWAPFPYGSNRVWAELALGLGFGGILFAWSGLVLTGFATTPLSVRPIVLPALCVAGALGWAFFQSVDLEAVVHLTGIDLRALANPIWPMASAALGREAGAFISIDPETTRHAIFVSALTIGAFLIAYELARDRDRALTLLNGIVVVSTIYAAVALAAPHFNVDLQALVMPDARTPSSVVAGSFINANHFATLMALGAVASLGLFVEALRQATVWDRGPRTLLRTATQALGSTNALWLVATVVIVTAIVLIQSRTGIIAFLIGTLALIIALSAGTRWSSSEELGYRAMTAVLVAVLGIATALSLDPLLGRANGNELDDDLRTALTESAMKAIAAAPLAGHGFGAFEHYEPLFADGSAPGNIGGVHNDLLETLADLGLPAGFALVAAPMLLAGMCFSGCIRRRRDRMYSAVGFAGSVVVGVHALVESSLQIPAVAVFYAALLGLGVAQSWRTGMDAVR